MPVSMRQTRFSLPAIAHTTNGIKHRELSNITQPTRHTKATAAAIMCVRLSSSLNRLAPPHTTMAKIPNAGNHCHPCGVMSSICGNSNVCDHKAARSNHRHRFANWEKLPCVPVVTAIQSISTRKAAMAITVVNASAAILSSD